MWLLAPPLGSGSSTEILKHHLCSCLLTWDLPLALPTEIPGLCGYMRREVSKRKGREDRTLWMMCKDGESSGNFEEGYEKSEWQHGQVGRTVAWMQF